MTNTTNQQLTEMMEEIQSIKSIINQKKPVLHVLLHPKHLKLFMLLTGVGVSVLSLAYYYLEQRYGVFRASPESIRQVFKGLVIAIGTALFALLFILWSRSIKKNGGKLAGEHVMSALFSFRVINLLLPVRFLAFVLILYCIDKETYYYIIPILSIAIGLQFNFLGCMTETKNYVVSGYWFILTAIIVFLFTSIPASLAVLISLGCGSLLFGILPNPEK